VTNGLRTLNVFSVFLACKWSNLVLGAHVLARANFKNWTGPPQNWTGPPAGPISKLARATSKLAQATRWSNLKTGPGHLKTGPGRPLDRANLKNWPGPSAGGWPFTGPGHFWAWTGPPRLAQARSGWTGL